MTRCLVLDVGGTSCRAAVFDGESRVGFAVQPSGRTAGDMSGVTELLPRIRTVVEQVRPDAIDAVCAGVAGITQSWGHAQRIAHALGAMVGTDRVLVTGDMVSCHAGALSSRPGVVVAAGTGAVALAVDHRGASARVDGWGYLLGDEGSGFTVGRAGLVAALRAADGRGGSPALLELAQRRYGPVGEFVDTIHGADSPARAIAAFAPDVAEAARAGDCHASAAWSAAARALAETAAAAAARVFAHPGQPVAISYTGSIFDLRDLVLEPFTAHLAELTPQARLQAPYGDAIEGGRLLAVEGGDGIYAELLYRLTEETGTPPRVGSQNGETDESQI